MSHAADIVRMTHARLGSAVIMRQPTGAIVADGARQLSELERRGLITKEEGMRAFDQMVTALRSEVGAGAALPQPLWVRSVMTREGDDIVTRCTVVTPDGSGMAQLCPVEVRVNIPKLVATLKFLGLAPKTGDGAGDGVSGFGSWLKKAVKTVTHAKVVQAVGKVVTKVARSPIVQIANPALAISAHTLSRAAGGKGTIKGAAGRLVDAGTAAVTKVAPIPSALGYVSPKAAAALGVGLKTVTTARAGGVIAAVAKNAQREVELGKSAAQAILAKSPDKYLANPALVKRAQVVRANVQRVAPGLARQVVASSKVKTSIGDIAARAKAGDRDAYLAASVIARSARALDTVSRLEQQYAGGVAGLLITADGRIVKAPRGSFVQHASAAARPDVLYRGPGAPTLKGSFTAVGSQRFGEKRAVYSSHGLDRHALSVGDEIRFGHKLTKRVGTITAVTPKGYVVLSKTHRSRPPETIVVAPGAVIGRRVQDSIGAASIGATPEWGGALDPGNDIDGPLYPPRYPGEDDVGVLTP